MCPGCTGCTHSKSKPVHNEAKICVVDACCGEVGKLRRGRQTPNVNRPAQKNYSLFLLSGPPLCSRWAAIRERLLVPSGQVECFDERNTEVLVLTRYSASASRYHESQRICTTCMFATTRMRARLHAPADSHEPAT